MSDNPLIIIGAPRSGTNMLRDLLCQIDGMDTWPCDEINYIWRYGNRSVEHDQLDSAMANTAVSRYIRKAFIKIKKTTGCQTVVEKTCANSLRVPFIDAIFPEARYIFIVRDGLDTVVSARERRKSKIDLAYTWAKLKYVPLRDIPYYGGRYVVQRIKRLFDSEQALVGWGPKPSEPIPENCSVSSLALSAHQWSQCVNQSDLAFSSISASRVHRVTYEEFVRNPIDSMKDIFRFLELPTPDPSSLDALVSTVRKGSVGRGRQVLTESELAEVEPLIRSTLERTGYSWQ